MFQLTKSLLQALSFFGKMNPPKERNSKMKEKFMNGLLTLAGKMQSNSVLSAVKDAFVDNMPVVIWGAFCTLFQFVLCQVGGVPDPKTGELIYYVSLANVPGFAWLHSLNPIFTTANYGCMNFMAVAICVLVAMHFAENIGHPNDKTVPAVALASFVTLINTTASTTTESGETVTISNVVASSYTSATGLFVGLLVGILSTLLYVKLVDSGKLKISLPDSVPPNVSQSFAVLFPTIITILCVSIVGYICSMFGLTMFDIIKTIMAPVENIMTGLPGYLVVLFLMQLLWWFGIHGPNVMGAVTSPFMTKMMATNLALYQAGEGVSASGVYYQAGSPYSIIASPFEAGWRCPTGSGITGGLIIAVLLFSKRDDFKAIAKLAIPCGIFNINEPIIFGIPMVMNPMFAVPFFLAPIACASLGYLVQYLGLCPLFVISVPWTTPVGLFGFLASSGNIMGGIWQAVIIIAVSTLIYTPFVIASNRQEEAA